MSALLLDTHVLLWWLADHPRLTTSMRAAIAEPTSTVLVSAATAWEMSIKAALGRLDAPDDLAGELARQGFDELPVTMADGTAAGRLPRHHDDPFDRMLVAQARRLDATLVSADARLVPYDVRLLS